MSFYNDHFPKDADSCGLEAPKVKLPVLGVLSSRYE